MKKIDESFKRIGQKNMLGLNFLKSYVLSYQISPLFTLGPKPTFYPEFTKNLIFDKCVFCEKWDFEKCEFCEKWDFENLNFAKNEILKIWILW